MTDIYKIKRYTGHQVQGFIFIATINLKKMHDDTQKDPTWTQMNIEGTLHQQWMLAEHTTLIEESFCSYINHVLPITSSSKDIDVNVIKFWTDRNIHFPTLLVLKKWGDCSK